MAVVSVLEQRTQVGMVCPDGGAAPGWPATDPSRVHDDPRTPDVDERVSGTTSSSAATTSSAPTTATTVPPTAGPTTAGPTTAA